MAGTRRTAAPRWSIAWEAAGSLALAAMIVVAGRGSLFDPPVSLAALAILVVGLVGLAASITQGRAGGWSAAVAVAAPVLAGPSATAFQSAGARTVALALPPLAVAGAAAWQRRLAGPLPRWPAVTVAVAVALSVVVDLWFRNPYRELNCTPSCPVNPWAVDHRPGWVSAAGWLVLAAVVVASIVAARAVVAVGWSGSAGWSTLFVTAAMVAGAVALRWRGDHRLDSAWTATVAAVELVAIAAAATTALVPVGRGYLGRRRVRDWITEVKGTESAGAVDLLQLAADDPTLRFVDAHTPVPAQAGATSGSPVAVLAPGRATTTLRRHGRAVAVVEHRRESGDRLRAAITPTVIALVENEQLLQRAGEQLDELRSARRETIARIDLARQRLQRDLHDGAQQHLIALGMALSADAADAADAADGADAARASLDEAALQASLALERLRGIAHAQAPPLLDDAGLYEALRSLAEDCEIDLALRLPAWPAARPAKDVEHAAYWLVVTSVAEAVAAGTRCLTVAIEPVGTVDSVGPVVSVDLGPDAPVGQVPGVVVITAHAAEVVADRVPDADRIHAAGGTLTAAVEGGHAVYRARFP